MATLLEAFRLLALDLQEAATELSHSDVHQALSDQLDDMHPDEDCCVCDVYGDDQSGDVVYRHGGQVYKAPYTLGSTNGKRTAEIDEDSKTNVVPRTVYDEEADDDDSYASMESAFVRDGLYKALPTYERFIGKSERDNANAKDFAGKGKSYPILKPGDVMAAVRSMGRAGSDNVGTSTLKSNIIAIAKRKGFTKYLPKAWQGGDSSESRVTAPAAGAIELTEAATTFETIRVAEAKADYEIRLISPGKGSTAYYPKEVLQRDGPKVFKAGTHVYLNHPTTTEEAERPEGDVKNLAGVLTTDATYSESHPKGEGLYARMKVFADHAQTVEEKAPHVGMSIRASGKAESNRRQDGLPVLSELTSAESVDIVTKPGRDGRIFTEAARRADSPKGEDMDLKETQRLINEAVAPFHTRQRRDDAQELAEAMLEGVSLPEAAKARVVKRAVEHLDAGRDVDEKALRDLVISEAREEGRYLAEITGAGRVTGMGISEAGDLKIGKKERKALKEARKEQRRDDVSVFESIGMPRELAKVAASGRVA